MLDQMDDGSHEITLNRIGGDAKSYGVLRWSAAAGLTCSLTLSVSHQPPISESVGVGRFKQDCYDQPEAIAFTDDGTRIELYGLRLDRFPKVNHEVPESVVRELQDAEDLDHIPPMSGPTYTGTALKAVIDIARDLLLAFDNSTEESNRLYFSGSTGMLHHSSEAVTFVARDGSSTQTRRVCTPLSDGISLIGINVLIKGSDGGWLAYKYEPPSERDLGGTSEQLFISFLNGRKVPFHWWDKRDGAIIRRTYYGSQILKHEHYNGIMTLPLDGIEAAQYGIEVLQNLPTLFEGFCRKLGQVNFAPALNSMWVARESYLDHQMAVASVGVEQVLKAWREWKKSPNAPQIATKKSIWRDESLKKVIIQNGLMPVLNELIQDNRLSHLTLEEKNELAVLRSRLQSLWKPKNEMALATPFAEAGLVLSELEIKSLKRRDPHLHGEWLDYPLNAADLDHHAEHLDSLCMLITKFVLKLAGYTGTYRDFASRPIDSNFEIKRLS
ncbi:MAG: hypothetical protein JWP89_3208 [Schlesneria sp.]|nr:hypothetical protein [Schlesneria sp.]